MAGRGFTSHRNRLPVISRSLGGLLAAGRGVTQLRCAQVGVLIGRGRFAVGAVGRSIVGKNSVVVVAGIGGRSHNFSVGRD